MARIQQAKQDMIRTMGKAFDRLERKNTDLTGWLMLKLGCDANEARHYADWYESQRDDPERNMTDAERAEHSHRLGNPERNAATVVPTPGAMKAAVAIAPPRHGRLTPEAYDWHEEVKRVAQSIDAALGLPEVIEALDAALHRMLERGWAIAQDNRTRAIYHGTKAALARLKGEK